jgi:predicted metal-dependent hydrolase
VKRFSILAAAAAMALLALPATSLAASPHTARVHFLSADDALGQVAQYVISNPGRAAAALARERRARAALRRDARALRRSARTVKQRVQAAKAYRLLASQQSANVATLSAIFAWAGDLQDEMAQAMLGAANGREAAIEAMKALAPYLPAEAQEKIARAIAAYTEVDEAAFASLSQTLATGDLPVSVSGLVTTVLDVLTGALNAAVDHLSAVTALLPAEFQPLVADVFALVRTNITGVTSIIKNVLGSVFGVTDGNTVAGISLPIPFKLPIALPGFGG